MKREPPRTLPSIVRYLLPQGAREHVLGDLEELCPQTRSTARRLFDVLRVWPYVIRGQAARNLDGRLIALETLALSASIALASLRMPAAARVESVPAMMCFAAVAMAALILGDIYVEPRNRAQFHTVRQILLAYGSAWLAASLAARIVPQLGPMRAIVSESAKSGVFLLFVGRLVFNSLVREIPAPCAPASYAEMRREAFRFQRLIRQRNVVEYAAAAIAIAGSAAAFVRASQPLQRASLILAIFGLLSIVYGLYRRGSSRPIPASGSDCETLRLYRAQLARQRDALRGVPYWYIGPLVPALVLMTAAQIASRAGSGRIAGTAGITIVFMSFLIWLNRRAARAVQLKLEALDDLENLT